jgi:hypothetical protein
MEEITFRNKREDFEAYHDYMLKETEEGKQIGKQVFIARSWFAILIMGLFFLLIWGIRGYLGASIQSTVFLAIGFVFLMIVVVGFVLLIMGFQPYYYVGKQVLKKNARSLTEKDLQIFQLPRTIKLNEDGLEIRNSEAIHRWRWGLVDSIGLTSNFIFLHVGKCCVFYIPKRDFPSEENFLAFGKKLVELTKKNQGQPLATGSLT